MVLISGLALAQATKRRFRMLWPLTPACAAPFDRLFENDWHVVQADAGQVAEVPFIDGLLKRRRPDLLTEPAPCVVIGHVSWLIWPDQFPYHADVAARCREIFQELQPVACIREQVDYFRCQSFRPPMIGVHLRRGDYARVRPDAMGNTGEAMIRVDAFLAHDPAAKIFLCTDDGAIDQVTGDVSEEGVRTRFRQRYGERVVFTQPRSLRSTYAGGDPSGAGGFALVA